MEAISVYPHLLYYDQESKIKANQCKTIVTFDNTPESKILDAINILILLNLQKPCTIACKEFLECLILNILHIIFLTDQSYVNVH